MKNLMISLVAAVSLVLSACGGSAGASAKANSADGMSSEGRVSKTWISGQSSDATMTTDATGEPATGTPPPQPTTSNRALPPECGGKMPRAQQMAQGTLVCRCESAGHEAVWSTFVWDEEAYPNCKVPFPSQVLNRVVNRPVAVSVQDDPYKDPPPPAAKVESTPTPTVVSSRTQVTCDSQTDGDKRRATCLVTKDNQPAQSYTCIGRGVKNLTMEQKLTYTGGPPCTCESGEPRLMGTPPNTWQCN